METSRFSTTIYNSGLIPVHRLSYSVSKFLLATVPNLADCAIGIAFIIILKVIVIIVLFLILRMFLLFIETTSDGPFTITCFFILSLLKHVLVYDDKWMINLSKNLPFYFPLHS